jgi:hypothetical protein
MPTKPYPRELGTALVLYFGLLLASNHWLHGLPPGTPWAEALALAPMLGVLACCWAIVRQLRRVDEMQLRLQLEALGFSFATTALLRFSYGFLEGLGYPRLSMFYVWPLMAALWVVGGFLAYRRYK